VILRVKTVRLQDPDSVTAQCGCSKRGRQRSYADKDKWSPDAKFPISVAPAAQQQELNTCIVRVAVNWWFLGLSVCVSCRQRSICAQSRVCTSSITSRQQRRWSGPRLHGAFETRMIEWGDRMAPLDSRVFCGFRRRVAVQKAAEAAWRSRSSARGVDAPWIPDWDESAAWRTPKNLSEPELSGKRVLAKLV
jgi:hypothetical protein